jgi:hypothetical protein
MAVTSKVLTNSAATQVEKVRKSGAVMSILPRLKAVRANECLLGETRRARFPDATGQDGISTDRHGSDEAALPCDEQAYYAACAAPRPKAAR